MKASIGFLIMFVGTLACCLIFSLLVSDFFKDGFGIPQDCDAPPWGLEVRGEIIVLDPSLFTIEVVKPAGVCPQTVDVHQIVTPDADGQFSTSIYQGIADGEIDVLIRQGEQVVCHFHFDIPSPDQVLLVNLGLRDQVVFGEYRFYWEGVDETAFPNLNPFRICSGVNDPFAIR